MSNGDGQISHNDAAALSNQVDLGLADQYLGSGQGSLEQLAKEIVGEEMQTREALSSAE